MRAALGMAGEVDQATLFATALDAIREVIGAAGASFWVGDEQATCRLARGSDAGALVGSAVPCDALVAPLAEGGWRAIAAPVIVGERTVGWLRASRADADEGPPFDAADRSDLALLAEATASALRTAARLKQDDRASDMRLVLEMSREIGSSLDLDRVLQTVVNIASRALEFDRGAVALYENGKCDIRALAGADTVDPSAEEMQDLAFRAAWAAGTGDALYLSDRESPTSDAERIFLQFFDGDLAKAEASSGLYLPLRDEEGIVGILLFEARRPDFAGERERDLATILANQATVAIRNAKLYSQVPLAEALGALSARRQAFLAIPQQRRAWAGAIALALLGAVTLIRWPLRVAAAEPVFRPTAFAEVRPLVDGTVDRVLVREGAEVAAGAPVAQLRDIEARSARASAEADLLTARRNAALAAARGDAAEQRLQLLLEDRAREDLRVHDEALGSLTLRSPVRGVVLTARPELLLDRRLRAGEPFVILGRTDSLELEFTVEQRDVARVRVGDEVRVRLEALPQRTFSGRVTVVGALPLTGDSSHVFYPVRATVPNPDGAIRPGMVAYARVLTAPASLAGRLLRTPVRQLRLFWWRAWSWL